LKKAILESKKSKNLVRSKIMRGFGGSFGDFDDQRITRIGIRVVALGNASATIGTVTNTEIDLSPPNWGARGVAFADLYQKYRIVGLMVRARMHPGFSTTVQQALWMAGNTSWYMAIYYGPKSTFTAPTTVANFIDFPHLVFANDAPPGKLSMKVSREDLMAHINQDWLQTAATGETDPETIQLCLEILSIPFSGMTQAAQLEIVIDLDIEFTGSVDPALIPLRRQKRLEYSSKNSGVTVRTSAPSTSVVVKDEKPKEEKKTGYSLFG